jgi:hypothetical protein
MGQFIQFHNYVPYVPLDSVCSSKVTVTVETLATSTYD